MKIEEKIDGVLLNIGIGELRVPLYKEGIIGVRKLANDCADFESEYNKMRFDAVRIDLAIVLTHQAQAWIPTMNKEIDRIKEVTGLPAPVTSRAKIVPMVRNGAQHPVVLAECYWDLTEFTLDYKAILAKIFNKELVNPTFFIDVKKDIIFQPRADKTMDFIAADEDDIA